MILVTGHQHGIWNRRMGKYFFIFGYKIYAKRVEIIPIPAPATTSLNQCSLLYILRYATQTATAYPPIPYQTDTFLYSCIRNSADAKASAVWPDGKDR